MKPIPTTDRVGFRAPFAELDAPRRAASLDATLAGAPPGRHLWLFAYGSLMWRPAFDHQGSRPARLHGWHRRFCVWTVRARGGLERPGLGLGLERGGSCRGLALRLDREGAREALGPVWRREMLTGIYTPRWALLRTPQGTLRAIAFVVRRDHPQYAGRLAPETAACHIASAVGENGSCFDYLANTVRQLDDLGLRDRGLERLLDLARACDWA